MDTNYRFVRNAGEDIEVFNADGDRIAEIQEDNDSIRMITQTSTAQEDDSNDTEEERERERIQEAFEDFKRYDTRYAVLSKNYVKDKVALLERVIEDDVSKEVKLEALSDLYARLLRGCDLIKAEENHYENYDKVFDRSNKVIEWLKQSGFFAAPASTKYHESFEGGLCLHTLKVVALAIELADLPKFASAHVSLASVVRCCLVHDWCKIGKYEKYMRNVKNPDTGKWEQVASYRYAESGPLPLGHGETSMFMAMKCFKLSDEEAIAVRHHMGKWAAETSYTINDLQRANEDYPLVHLLQFADQLAIVHY